MATPDPHMEEMRILTYEPRPRTCKISFKVPRRQDYVEVKCCIDYLPGLPDRWCMAEVLHVSRSPAQDVLATGVIRYLPDDTWDEEIHEVEFLEDFGLRRINSHNDEDSSSSDMENPVTKWQLARPRAENSAPSDDDDWSFMKEENGRSLAISSMDIAATSKTQNLEIKSLREGYSSLVVEVEKIKKELLSQSQMISEVQRTDGRAELCSSVGCVLQRLRHKLGLKMQVGVRSISSTSARSGKRKSTSSDQTLEVLTGDGVHVGAVKVRVECTLIQFETVARQLKAKIPPQKVLFVPDFAHTQLPLPYSTAFRVPFKTFGYLTSQLGIGSLSDRLEMARKCGTGRQGDILRLLGTYAFDAEDDCSAATIYMGKSCGKICSSPNAEDTTENVTRYPLMTRATRQWDKVDRRFLHPIRLKSHPLPALDGSSELQAFSLTWRRAADLGPRIWSKAMTDTTTVFGWLEVCLPFIQVESDSLCREIGGLAGDEEWETLFNLDAQDLG